MASPRRPWLAGLLTVLSPGLGHVYAGRFTRGLLIIALAFLSLIVLAALAMSPVLKPPLNVLSAMLVLIAFLSLAAADAIRVARKQTEGYQRKIYNKWYIYIGVLLITSYIVSQGAREFVLRAYKIPAPSMGPTLLTGDRVLVDRFTYRLNNPRRGDVVVFKFPEDETNVFIKRVIGLPGETLEIRNKQVLINGQNFAEKYVIHIDPNIEPRGLRPRDNMAPIAIPQNAYFVLGDNRDQSLDSRFCGPVERSKILGKARTIYWSVDRSVRWERVGQPIN